MSNNQKHTVEDIRNRLNRAIELKQRILTVTESLGLAMDQHVKAAQADDRKAEDYTRKASHELLDHIMDLHIEMVSLGK